MLNHSINKKVVGFDVSATQTIITVIDSPHFFLITRVSFSCCASIFERLPSNKLGYQVYQVTMVPPTLGHVKNIYDFNSAFITPITTKRSMVDQYALTLPGS